jgi:hypothetical protein
MEGQYMEMTTAFSVWLQLNRGVIMVVADTKPSRVLLEQMVEIRK